MSSIRSRLFVIFIVTLTLVGGGGGLAFDAFQNYAHFNNELDFSYQITDQLQTLNHRRLTEEQSLWLKETLSKVHQPERHQILKDLEAAYANRASRTAQSRIDFFLRNEAEYRNFLRSSISYYEERLVYWGLLALGSAVLVVLFTLAFLQIAVFSELKSLSRKMVDFLHHRYTYQFSLPPPTEVGHLQATFNSMAQRVLVQMQELQALDKAKSDFLSIASHELRTPLTSIKGSLSLLRAGVVGELNEASNNLMEIAENETDRLIRLINDLLDLAKIEARKLPLNPQWEPLAELVEATFQALQGLAETSKVTLQLKDPTPVEVYMDRDRIQQVLTNLVSNAIKYSPEKGTVTVSFDVNPQEEIVISVTDQGQGIAPEDQELIFQKFRQATGPKNPLVKGTGLGLAIARALVEEHQGHIDVKSSPGQGCSFFFTLPKWRFSLKTHSQMDQAA